MLRTRLKCTLCKHHMIECASERDFTQAKFSRDTSLDRDDTFLAATPTDNTCHAENKQCFLVRIKKSVDRCVQFRHAIIAGASHSITYVLCFAT